MGLLIGKPLGIFGFTWLADKLGIASMPTSMNNKHLGVVGMLGGIGFTMCCDRGRIAIGDADVRSSPSSWRRPLRRWSPRARCRCCQRLMMVS